MNKQALMCKIVPLITQNTWRRIGTGYADYEKFACMTNYLEEYGLVIVFSTGAPACDYILRLSLWDNDMANRVGLVDISREEFDRSPNVVQQYISRLYYAVSNVNLGESFEARY